MCTVKLTGHRPDLKIGNFLICSLRLMLRDSAAGMIVGTTTACILANNVDNAALLVSNSLCYSD